MIKYIIPLILSIGFAAPSYACGCLPLDDEPPTKYVPFTITNVSHGEYAAVNKKKGQIQFTTAQITDGNELVKGDVVLVKETNDSESKMLGVELFIPYDQTDSE